jgi:hypothetical protein
MEKFMGDTDPIVGEFIQSRTQCSSEIGTLAGALAKAQGEMASAAKANINPHFKSRYADLASIWDACRVPLSKNGLAVLQPVRADGAKVTITTIIAHSSGQWLSESLTMTAQQNTPQAVGSAITYGRRYGLSAMVGIAPDDDDGNAASARQTPNRQAETVDISNSFVEEDSHQSPAPPGFEDWLDNLAAVAEEGTEPLQAMWSKSRAQYRRHLTTTNAPGWESLKAIAARVGEKVPAK